VKAWVLLPWKGTGDGADGGAAAAAGGGAGATSLVPHILQNCMPGAFTVRQVGQVAPIGTPATGVSGRMRAGCAGGA
jgi:hypothetical protein